MARYISILRGNPAAQVGMHPLRLLRRRGAARPDRPNRLIRNHSLGKTRDAVHGNHRVDLPSHHCLRLMRLMFFQRLADAQDRRESRRQDRGIVTSIASATI